MADFLRSEITPVNDYRAELGETPVWCDRSQSLLWVDINRQQADGDSRKILGFEPLEEKWAAFGWYVQRVNGNDLPAVIRAFDNAKQCPENQPRVILCDTLMGKGVPFLETRDKNHFIRVDADEWQKALAVLDANTPTGAHL